MITHDLRWSLPRGNPPVPCCWQATAIYRDQRCLNREHPRREASNQVSNDRRRQRRTPADTDGQHLPGQEYPRPGSPHR
jgi:hypothetical protein